MSLIMRTKLLTLNTDYNMIEPLFVEYLSTIKAYRSIDQIISFDKIVQTKRNNKRNIIYYGLHDIHTHLLIPYTDLMYNQACKGKSIIIPIKENN